MASVMIEALKVGEETDDLVEKLRRAASDNPFEEQGAGRWRVRLNHHRTGDEAEDAIEAELDALHGGDDWRERLRLVGSDD